MRPLPTIALALVASVGTINHARLRAVTTGHPVDLSKTLQHLTLERMLESTGGRGAIYHLPGEAIPKPEDVFGSAPRLSLISSPVLKSSSPDLDSGSPNSGEKRDADGCLIAEQLPLPLYRSPTRRGLRIIANASLVPEPYSRLKIVQIS